MSHIGKKQIEIPEGVKSGLDKNMLFKVTGPLGSLEYEINLGIEVKIEDNMHNTSVRNRDDLHVVSAAGSPVEDDEHPCNNARNNNYCTLYPYYN